MAKNTRKYTAKSLYLYSKKRKDFGRQPLFEIVPGYILDSIYPDTEMQKQYMLRNPVHQLIQATLPQSTHEVNTKQIVIRDEGVNHAEGGWPKDVHHDNEEHVYRYRRKAQHDEDYVDTIENLCTTVKHLIDQNNAIHMYESYFSGMSAVNPVEQYDIVKVNKFTDVYKRSISAIAWTAEKESKILVSYSDRIHHTEPKMCKNESILLWDIHKQTAPIRQLKPEYECWHLAGNSYNPDLFVTGLANGTVSLFDIRANTNSVSNSSVYNSHLGPITSVYYTSSRSNTEFFTGSLDGQCLWWDQRNLSQPMDQLFMSIKLKSGEKPSFQNTESISSLQFDSLVPTKLLAGTSSGLVININNMGRTHSEKMTNYWTAHSGPIRAVHRSHCTMRMFVTCGDYNLRIWSEEVRSNPIIVTKPHKAEVMDACWTKLRYSSLMTVCADGFIHYWDFLRKYKEPVASKQVSKNCLNKITAHPNGKFVAVGNTNGTVHLLKLSENMRLPDANDKQLMNQVYDRETKREHILDARVREIRLKLRQEEELAAAAAAAALEEGEVEEEQDIEAITEEEYMRIVNEELTNMGIYDSNNLLTKEKEVEEKKGKKQEDTKGKKHDEAKGKKYDENKGKKLEDTTTKKKPKK